MHNYPAVWPQFLGSPSFRRCRLRTSRKIMLMTSTDRSRHLIIRRESRHTALTGQVDRRHLTTAINRPMRACTWCPVPVRQWSKYATVFHNCRSLLSRTAPSASNVKSAGGLHLWGRRSAGEIYHVPNRIATGTAFVNWRRTRLIQTYDRQLFSWSAPITSQPRCFAAQRHCSCVQHAIRRDAAIVAISNALVSI